jgi:hypothetical protein
MLCVTEFGRHPDPHGSAILRDQSKGYVPAVSKAAEPSPCAKRSQTPCPQVTGRLTALGLRCLARVFASHVCTRGAMRGRDLFLDRKVQCLPLERGSYWTRRDEYGNGVCLQGNDQVGTSEFVATYELASRSRLPRKRPAKPVACLGTDGGEPLFSRFKPFRERGLHMLSRAQKSRRQHG